MAQWLAHLEFELLYPLRFPGGATIPLRGNLGQVVYTASPVSQLQETLVQKRSFRRLSANGD